MRRFRHDDTPRIERVTSACRSPGRASVVILKRLEKPKPPGGTGGFDRQERILISKGSEQLGS
jgi:hypothetical protein